MKHYRKNGGCSGGQQTEDDKVRSDESTHFAATRQTRNQRDRRGGDDDQSDPPKWIEQRASGQIGTHDSRFDQDYGEQRDNRDPKIFRTYFAAVVHRPLGYER